MLTPFPQFSGASYNAVIDSKNQRTINLYLEGSDDTIIMKSWPGLKHYKTLTGTIRGMYESNRGSLYVCAGNKLFEIIDDDTPIERFTLKTSIGPVSMIDNKLSGLVLVDGNHGYYLAYNTTGSISAIWPPDYTSNKLILKSASHGLLTGDSVVLSGVSAYDGTYTITVEDEDTFSIADLEYVPTPFHKTGTLAPHDTNNSLCTITIVDHGYDDSDSLIIYPTAAVWTDAGQYTIQYVDANKFNIELDRHGEAILDVATDALTPMTWTLDEMRMTEITGLGWRGSDYVDYQDSFYIFSTNASEGPMLYYGEDPRSLNALDYVTMGDIGDGVVRVLTDHGHLWVFRDRSTVIYYNSGQSDSVFVPMSGSKSESGCVSGRTIAKCGGSLFWLAQDDLGGCIVMRSEGAKGARISTHSLEKELMTATDLSGASAWSCQIGGHGFYILNVPGLKTSWVFDIITGVWTEIGNWISNDWERDRVDFHAYHNSKHIVGDYKSGILWELDPNTNTRYLESELDGTTLSNQPVTWLRQAQQVKTNMNRLFYNSFLLNIEVGQSYDLTDSITPPTAGSSFIPVTSLDSKVILYYSDNSGRSWSEGLEQSTGSLGEYETRVEWFKLGDSRSRIFKVTGSIPVSHNIIGAFIDVTSGNY